MILKAGKPTRSAMLAASKDYVRSVKQAREDELQKQFADLGIDWSTGRPHPTALTAQVKLGDNAPLVAGQKVPVTVTVTNRGKFPAHQVRAITDCELGSFKDLEFLFGKIDPGASRSFTREVKLPGTLFSLVEPLDVKVFESAENQANESEVMVNVMERPVPSFAYNLVVVDDGTGRSRGNGDGRIQRGEDIDLVVLMKNVGKGASSKAMAKIQNKSGKFVFLKTGTANLKEVGTGSWVAGRFHFQVKEGLAEDQVQFDMISGDASFLRRPKDVIFLPVDKGPTPQIQASSNLVRARSGTPLQVRGAAGEDVAPFAQVAGGSVLQATGRTTGWTRVQVPWKDGMMSGWIADAGVEPGSGTPAVAAAFTPLFDKVPPVVTLPIVKHDLPNSTREVELKGDVWDDEGVSSLYVFVNNKKRYLTNIKPQQLKPSAEGGVRAEFQTLIPLEEGTNTIEVYARDNDKLQSLDIFQIHRAKSVSQQAVNDNRKEVTLPQR